MALPLQTEAVQVSWLLQIVPSNVGAVGLSVGVGVVQHHQ